MGKGKKRTGIGRIFSRVSGLIMVVVLTVAGVTAYYTVAGEGSKALDVCSTGIVPEDVVTLRDSKNPLLKVTQEDQKLTLVYAHENAVCETTCTIEVTPKKYIGKHRGQCAKVGLPPTTIDIENDYSALFANKKAPDKGP